MKIHHALALLAVSLLPWQQALAHGAGTGSYPASAIPAELKEGANAVIRHENTTFRILSPGKALKTLERVVTVLNPQGDDEAVLVSGYDKLDKIRKIDGSLHAAGGELVRRLKKSEISDHSYSSSVNFFHDNRYKVASLKHSTYPYTVSWQLEEEVTNMLFYPVWLPGSEEKVSVEQREFIVITPPQLAMNHRSYQLADPHISTLPDGSRQYRWQVSKLATARPEYFSPYWDDSPYVITAPEGFELEGYKGSLASWQELGKFIHQLNQGRDALPEQTRAEVLRRISGCSTTEEKVKAIYEYMQQHTRYVSIQLGIGGWQPFEASFVQQKGYGDCKALTNYTHSLLKAAGIPSHYSLIAAGPELKERVVEAFPRSYFNHVILCVPMEKDTLWLECTSQTDPAGHLGRFTGNRKALVIREDGGHLVNTRYYGPADNLRSATTQVDLQHQEPAYTLARTYHGVLFDTPHAYTKASAQEQKKWVLSSAGLPEIGLEEYKLLKKEGYNPQMRLEVSGKLQDRKLRSGNRLFLPLYLGSLPVEIPTPSATRKNDFVQSWGYTFADTLVYQLPQGVVPEHLPEAQQLTTPWGEFSLQTRFANGALTTISRIRLNEGRYPASDYTEWVVFMQQIRRAASAKAVLVQQ
ncbi:DUF3857 domain-containing protein [Cesiribacter andamanensis]|uniref:DUF3857 domain-containing protein n=1 Tax=Cesiribacter andamanensis AMV16 TaxID=1279009 RepID=M7NAZ3_9BACT|nr:DUF3857 domain-containing protein [Cesiribacter andamanensis]EMR04351.1 hypothetical protein ADICEAN_00514 [Cesiribacter andamanensis AMV16]